LKWVCSLEQFGFRVSLNNQSGQIK
jgi:hypothetical protein